MMSGKFTLAVGVLLGVLGTTALHNAAFALDDVAPVVTDSRIKTLVYSENEVYRLVLHYGYQAHIQLEKNETIQAISVGDSYAWKVTPIEYRIFIKPLEESAHTNMTIITDKHTYQFDLQSKEPGDNIEDDLVYQVRFFYPDGNFDMPHLAEKNQQIPAGPAMAPPLMPDTMPPLPASMPGEDISMMQRDNAVAMPVPSKAQQAPVLSGDASAGQYNFNYTLTGTDSIAPTRVFDDGRRTYFEFPNNNALIPFISAVRGGDNETPLSHYMVGNFVAVDALEKKFALRLGQDVVYVYNESGNGVSGGK